MKRMTFLLFLPALAILIGCGNEKASKQDTSSEVDQLKDRVMEIHDEVMPKMSDLSRMSRTLKAIPEERYDQIDTAVLSSHIRELSAARESMMEWMANYRPMADTLPKEKAMEYFNEQEEQIQQVADRMNNSLTEAKKWYRDEIGSDE